MIKNMLREVKVDSVYRHFKGITVQVIALAKDSTTLDDVVVYQHTDTNEYWVRSLDEFLSKVDKEKYPDIDQEYRFEEIE